jgi:UDPglucose 6-dehydrogenase
MPIFEPGLAELVENNVKEGRLFFTDAADAIKNADAVFIAVGTPSRRGDGHADLSYVYAAAERDRRAHGTASPSSSPSRPCRSAPGDEVEEIIRKTNPNAKFAVVSNPEFLREGAAIGDFKRPDRVVVGTDSDERARE